MNTENNIKIAFIVINAAKLLMNIINSDDEEEDFNDNLIILKNAIKKKRVCIRDYSDIVMSYDHKEFQKHFRMERKNFDYLVNYIGRKIQIVDESGRPQISIEKQLQITLWIFGNQEVYRTVADRFDVSLSTAWTSVNRISTILSNNCSDFISWPTPRKAADVVYKWYEISGFPDIIGAIDGSYIPICTPSKHAESYFCRKKYHAITLQGVCSFDMQFIDVDVGFPSSMHDARIFRCSDLKTNIDANGNNMFYNNLHMIGDTAYPNSKYLLVPFKRYHQLTSAQKIFNKKLSQSRVLIEQTFGLLKGRFRRLKFMNMYRTDLIPLYVLSMCVLHNICLHHRDETEIEIELENEDEPIQYFNDNDELDEGSEGGNLKRNEIMLRL